MSRLSFPLATEGWRRRWAVSERKSVEIVRGLRGHGDTGGLSERSVVREKGNHSSFYCLPQSHAVWISLTLRVTSKSCSNLTLEWSVTTWLPSIWDMALRFRSVLKAMLMYDVIPSIFKPQYATSCKLVQNCIVKLFFFASVNATWVRVDTADTEQH